MAKDADLFEQIREWTRHSASARRGGIRARFSFLFFIVLVLALSEISDYSRLLPQLLVCVRNISQFHLYNLGSCLSSITPAETKTTMV